MDNNYCIIHVEKKKSVRALGFAYKHNYRTCETAAPNAYKELAYKNEELIKDDFGVQDRDFVKIYRNKIKKSPYYKEHTVRKNAVPAIEVLLSFSKDQRSNIDIDAWKKANVEWLQEKYGKDNVISAMYHDDEKDENDENGTGCHIHAIVIPMDDKGCLNASKMVGNKYQMSALQSEYANRMEVFGLTRGELGKKDRHLSPREFHERINVELNKINREIPLPAPEEKATDYLGRIQQGLWEIARDHAEESLLNEREKKRRKDEERKQKEYKSLEDELDGIRSAKQAARHEKDLREIRELLGFTSGSPSREQIHEAKKKLRIANNVVEAFQTYPDHEFAVRVNNEMALILQHNNRMKKQKKKDEMVPLFND